MFIVEDGRCAVAPLAGQGYPVFPTNGKSVSGHPRHHGCAYAQPQGRPAEHLICL